MKQTCENGLVDEEFPSPERHGGCRLNQMSTVLSLQRKDDTRRSPRLDKGDSRNLAYFSAGNTAFDRRGVT